jgi:hypothetical protein
MFGLLLYLFSLTRYVLFYSVSLIYTYKPQMFVSGYTADSLHLEQKVMEINLKGYRKMHSNHA